MRHCSWYVYILTNYTNSVLYTGITRDVKRRLYEHRHRTSNGSFVTKYRLYKLIWYEEFPNPSDAIAAEKKIKGWTRAKKFNLIKEKNPSLFQLYQES